MIGNGMFGLLRSIAVGNAFSHSGFVEDLQLESVSGWCYSPLPWRRPVSLRVELNGVEVAQGRADIFREDLRAAGFGSGRCGFEIAIPAFAMFSDLKVFPQDSDTPLQMLVLKPPIDEVRQFQSGKIMPGRGLDQIFTAEYSHFSGVSLPLSTRAQSLTGSSVTFSISKITKGGKRLGEPELLFTMTEDVDAFAEGEHFPIFFKGDPDSQGEQYLLKITSDDATPETAVMAWMQNGSLRIGGHLQCFYAGRDAGSYGVIANLNYSPPMSEFSVPHTILYSSVSQCNLNCVHCISRESRKSVHRLGNEVREQLRSWCRSGKVRRIFTDYSGDLLWADDRWGGELDFLIDLGVPYFIDTNGVHLNEERGLKILRSKNDGLNVSLDAARPETYKQIRKGSAPLHEVLENAAAFGRLRDRENAKERVSFSLGFVMMRSNIEQLLEFIDIGVSVGADRIECRHMEAYTPDMAQESLWNHKQLFNDIRLAAIEHAGRRRIQLGIAAAFDQRQTRPRHRFCGLPWYGAVVLASGDVQVCCLPKTKIGNLREQTMEEIWNGDKYQAFREVVNSDKPPVFCDSCSYSRVPANALSYLPYLTIGQWKEPYSSLS